MNRCKDSEERASYILMERIQPIIVQSYPVVSGSDVPVELTDMVSELGIYGVLVARAHRDFVLVFCFFKCFERLFIKMMFVLFC